MVVVMRSIYQHHANRPSISRDSSTYQPVFASSTRLGIIHPHGQQQAIQDELLDGDGSGADPLDFADAAQRVLDSIKNGDFLAYSVSSEMKTVWHRGSPLV